MKLDESRPRSVAVLRALQLGDLLCAVPAFRALRAGAPGARICLVGLPWARGFARRYSAYFDDFLEFPGYPGLPERTPDLRRIPDFLREAQGRRFDLAIQMHGSGSYVNSLTALLGARHQAGYTEAGAWCPEPDNFMTYPEEGPEIRRHLRLLRFLGAPPRGEAIDFPVADEERSEWRALAQAHRLRPSGYACVHPGARWPSRRWLPERFAAVADALAARGLAVVLTGSRAERGLAADVRRRMRAPALDLCGRTSLGALACLLESARILISNDTGVSHLAAAVRTRSVIVVLGSDPLRWAPLDAELHRTVSHPVRCRPCVYQDCPIGHACATRLPARSVIEEALTALSADKEVVAIE